MSMRKLLKLQRELDILELKSQLWDLKYHSFFMEKKREEGPAPPTAQTAPQRTHSQPNEEMRCFGCQGLGHITSECPNERIVTLAEFQVPFEEFEKEEEEEEKGSYPSKPITPSNFFPQEGPTPQNSPLLQLNEQTIFKEEEENREVCVMGEVEEDVEEGGLLVLRRSLSKTEESLKDGGVLSSFFEPNPKTEPHEIIVFNDSNLKPYFLGDKLENLRTNSFLEGENDVYLLGVHFHSPNSTLWEASSMQTHAWHYSFWALLFEFHDKRHVMEFYLARLELKQSNSALGTPPGIKPVLLHLLVQDPDGDQATNRPKDEEETKEANKVTKEVKEVHAMVRNITNQDLDLLPGSAMFYPGFVRLITNDPGGDSAHSAHDTLA